MHGTPFTFGYPLVLCRYKPHYTGYCLTKSAFVQRYPEKFLSISRSFVRRSSGLVERILRSFVEIQRRQKSNVTASRPSAGTEVYKVGEVVVITHHITHNTLPLTGNIIWIPWIHTTSKLSQLAPLQGGHRFRGRMYIVLRYQCEPTRHIVQTTARVMLESAIYLRFDMIVDTVT